MFADRHELLGAGVRDRPQPRAGPAGEDETLHRGTECGTDAAGPPSGARPARPAPSLVVRSVAITVITLMMAAFVSVTGTAPAAASSGSDEQAFFDLTNAARAQSGLGPLAWSEGLANIARVWSGSMASSQALAHNPTLVGEVGAWITPNWQRLGENVGFGGSIGNLQAAFMNSPGHRANVLGNFNQVGIGVVRDGNGTIWVTLDFMLGPPPPPPPTPIWFLRNTLTTGVANTQFLWGNGYDRVLACDWNGDHVSTAGIFRDGVWFITNQNPPGSTASFMFGSPGDIPLCGDWDGNGTDTVGVWRNGRFFLRNSNSSGVADVSVQFGNNTDYPVVGDWNGDGTTTLGVKRLNRFYLRNSNTTGVADIAFGYGDPLDQPLAGDWNGDGRDSVGVWRNGTLFLTDQNATGVANNAFGFGNATDVPIVGDWDGGTPRRDTVGVVRPRELDRCEGAEGAQPPASSSARSRGGTTFGSNFGPSRGRPSERQRAGRQWGRRRRRRGGRSPPASAAPGAGGACRARRARRRRCDHGCPT